jgi:transposase
MEREWLAVQLGAGRSFESIADELGLRGSTVSYWARKYGLASSQAARHAPRGAPDRARLEALAASGATLAEIAAEVDRSITTVRYWLARWGIARARKSRRPRDLETAPAEVRMTCARHGRTSFRLEGRGYYRCKRCRQERVSEWRRRVKLRLVAEAGGSCRGCGYDRCVAALQFHHLEPSSKSFALSREGVTRSFSEARAEAKKCVLLCANCHAEVEAGYRTLDVTDSLRQVA